MTFPRVKIGGWGVGEKLTSTQMNTLDIDHSNALDVSGAGGTYTQGGPIVINPGGNNWTFASPMVFSSNNIQFTANSGTTVSYAGGVQFLNTISLSAGAAGSPGSNIQWRLNARNSTADISIDYDIYRITSLVSNIILTIRHTANGGVSPAASTGSQICVSRWSETSANTVTIKREDATTLATFPVSVKSWCRFIYTGTVWEPMEWGGNASV